MLLKSNLPAAFWAEALATATYIRNRLPTKSLPYNMSPHKAWFGKTPAILHNRQFGCIAYARNSIDAPNNAASSASSQPPFIASSHQSNLYLKENSLLPQSAFNIPNPQAKIDVINDVPVLNIPAPPAYLPPPAPAPAPTERLTQHPLYPIPPPLTPTPSDDSVNDDNDQLPTPPSTPPTLPILPVTIPLDVVPIPNPPSTQPAKWNALATFNLLPTTAFLLWILQNHLEIRYLTNAIYVDDILVL